VVGTASGSGCRNAQDDTGNQCCDNDTQTDTGSQRDPAISAPERERCHDAMEHRIPWGPFSEGTLVIQLCYRRKPCDLLVPYG